MQQSMVLVFKDETIVICTYRRKVDSFLQGEKLSIFRDFPSGISN